MFFILYAGEEGFPKNVNSIPSSSSMPITEDSHPTLPHTSEFNEETTTGTGPLIRTKRYHDLSGFMKSPKKQERSQG